MTKKILALGFVAVGILPLAANASLITGELNFVGAATISFGSITFDNGNVFSINPANTQQGGFMALGEPRVRSTNITEPARCNRGACCPRDRLYYIRRCAEHLYYTDGSLAWSRRRGRLHGGVILGSTVPFRYSGR